MILIIAEKPLAGLDIAAALGATKKFDGYVCGEDIVVTWANGHLIGLKEPEEVDKKYSVWNLNDLPIILPEKDNLKVIQEKEFSIIKKLINDKRIEEIVNAGDPGREGEVIQRWIYKMAGNEKPVSRMWCDTLTPEAIRFAFKNRSESYLYDNLYVSGVTRAELDMLLGVNYSRGLSLALAQGLTLTYGRCQTPLFNQIVKREIERRNFVPEEFWNISLEVECDNVKFNAILVERVENHWEKVKFWNLEEGKNVQNEIGNELELINFEKKRVSQRAPYLFNMNRLQQTMNRKFGYSASETMEICQNLYASRKIISYPRTDSVVLSNSFKSEIVKILWNLDIPPFHEYIEKIRNCGVVLPEHIFDDTKVVDHPAIIPALNTNLKEIYEKLTMKEKNVFGVIARSLIAVFFSDYVYSSATAVMENGDYTFLARGRNIEKPGWRIVLNNLNDIPDKQVEEEVSEGMLPNMNLDSNIKVLDSELPRDITRPKERYTEATLLELMQAWHIGTGATQAIILSDLTKVRGKNNYPYAVKKGKFILPTEFGERYISCVPEMLKSLEFVRDIEQGLKRIENGDLDKASFMRPILRDMQTVLDEIKAEGMKSEGKVSYKFVNENAILCPVCKKNFMVSYSWGMGCSGYKTGYCKFSVSNPFYGKLLSDMEMRVLLKNGSTGFLKGFRYKNRKGTYEAALKIEKGKVVLKRRDISGYSSGGIDFSKFIG